MDPENGYRYYSQKNLWQLDIITTCRKLDIPLDTVREILSKDNNQEVVALLQAHQEKALALSVYYQQVAQDISWYSQENDQMAALQCPTEIREEVLEAETALGGCQDEHGGYHFRLQEAAREPLHRMPTIRRKYGYVLDLEGLRQGRVVKLREYLKFQEGSMIPEESRMTIPAGAYALCTLEIRDETADFTPLLQARRNMTVPMAAQVVGALLNIVLDPLLIFGWKGVPALGVRDPRF